MMIKTSTIPVTQFSKNVRFMSKMCSKSLLIKEVGDKAVLILNRPKYLNAINLQLGNEFISAFKTLQTKKSLIIIRGAGDRALSVGGDVMEIKQTLEKGKLDQLGDFPRNLNTIPYLIHCCKISTIVFLNGFVVGSSNGLFTYAKYKIATEKTNFHLAEPKIGFHINGTYYFNRLKNKLGYYLVLTGNSLKGSDVYGAGLATHYCLSNNLQKLEETLLNSKGIDNIKEILDDICEKDIPEFSLSHVLGKIDEYFSQPTVEDIISKLEEDRSDWARHTVQALSKCSPSSLKGILRQMQISKNWSLEDCMVMECNLFINVFKFPDVLEGMRNELENVELPKWNPSSLADVTNDLVESHFDSVDEEKMRKIFSDIKNL